jgi:hypothetical protein
MASALGVDVATLDANCLDNKSKPREWCNAIDPALTRTLLDPDSYTRWMGVAPEAVDALRASQRGEGFRFANTSPAEAEPAAWTARLGELPSWDRYFSVYTGEKVDFFRPVFGGTPLYAYMFARSVRNVHTLITNAAFDANVPEEVLVPALRKFIAQYPVIAGDLRQADYAGSDPDAPSERIRFSYAASPEFGPATKRIVYFPSYAASGHMVTVSEPTKFQHDVSVFLSETGAASPSPAP